MRRLLPVLILALAAAGFLALRASRPAAPVAEARERVWRVAAEPLAVASVHPTLVLYGRIEAPDRIRAAAPVGGRVLELRVRDGDRVDAGAVLARMDPRDLAAAPRPRLRPNSSANACVIATTRRRSRTNVRCSSLPRPSSRASSA